MQALSAVAHHRQATAFFWAVLGKRRDDDMPARLDGTQDCLQVGLSLPLRGEEVKDRSVMPHVIGMPRKLDTRDVAHQPRHSGRTLAQSGLRRGQGGF